MKYRVIIQPPAIGELQAAYDYVREGAPARATAWFDEFLNAIDSLESFPFRCPTAPENGLVEPEIRQLLHGKRGGVYRVLFTVIGREVRVLHIRHGARRHLKRGEIELPPETR